LKVRRIGGFEVVFGMTSDDIALASSEQRGSRRRLRPAGPTGVA
jgi:hypothetical protein